MADIKSYKTLLRSADDEFIVNKSRFIGYASPAETEEEALAFIQAIHLKHRDATHNCYAYIIGQNSGIMRYSDDGEPGGTAGMPIMEVLKSQGLVNCCVVVTRYFGGILLGAGGLHRAYTQGCVIAVKAAQPVIMEPTQTLLCEVEYSLWDRVTYTLKSLPVQLKDSEFATSVTFRLLVREKDTEDVLRELTRITDGRFFSIEEEISWQAWEMPDSEN